MSKYYIGQTNNLQYRLWEHDTGQEEYTKHGAPWNLVGYLTCQTRPEAFKLETKLKKAKNPKYVLWYFKQHGTIME